MEKSIPVVGTILLDQTVMPNSSNYSGRGAHGKQADSGDKSFFDVNDSNVLSDIQKTTFNSLQKAKEMGTVKIGWIIFQFIGFPVYVYSWLNAIWTGDELKQWVLFLFGVIFAVIEGLRRYEIYRSKKMDNEERAYDLRRAHKIIERADKKAEKEDI